MLDGRYRFDNYVVGAANRLAASAVRAVAESPGAVYNPLFIYSNSGLGKTHLLCALGHAARRLHPELRTEYLTLDDFVEQLHQAIASGRADAFKRRYQDVDLLLLDDVQFLTGRVETQSEMLRVFNVLQGNGRQIVMASDRAPSEIADVDERLVSRLQGGLIVDIGAPDYETRVAILRQNCVDRALEFAPGVIEELSRVPTSSIRELQGALNRLVAHQAILDAPVSVADVWHVAGSETAGPSTVPDEFDNFLSDVALTVAETVDTWRLRLGTTIARWSGEGFRTAALEALLEGDEVPDLEAVEARFSAAAERLRSLECEAVRLDTESAALPVFRDPERLQEAELLLATMVARRDPPPAPKAGFRLIDLVRCPRNEVAIQASAVVVESPGARYNPLFLYGVSGVGKTHLANAIGNALRARNVEGYIVACLTGDAFVEEFIAALQEGRVERWRARYRAVDVLIVDGVQGLCGKERSQEEFFHIFNVLHEAGRQVVLTADRPVRELNELQSRLATRFEGGLVVELGTAQLVDRSGRHTPAPQGDEAAAPNIDRMLDAALTADTDDDLTSESLTPIGGRALDSFFFDTEKVVGEWPELEGRVLEELR
ncbi:MAG: DnaA/Hda family protein [Gemmatimonadaceae bacterium]